MLWASQIFSFLKRTICAPKCRWPAGGRMIVLSRRLNSEVVTHVRPSSGSSDVDHDGIIWMCVWSNDYSMFHSNIDFGTKASPTLVGSIVSSVERGLANRQPIFGFYNTRIRLYRYSTLKLVSSNNSAFFNRLRVSSILYNWLALYLKSFFFVHDVLGCLRFLLALFCSNAEKLVHESYDVVFRLLRRIVPSILLVTFIFHFPFVLRSFRLTRIVLLKHHLSKR